MAIRINMRNINSQLRQLNDAASRLNAQIVSINNMKNSIPSFWQGTAADTFTKKLENQRQELLSVKRQIDDVYQRIYNAAERIRRLEEELAKKATGINI